VQAQAQITKEEKHIYYTSSYQGTWSVGRKLIKKQQICFMGCIECENRWREKEWDAEAIVGDWSSK